jgi:hypothetical protein
MALHEQSQVLAIIERIDQGRPQARSRPADPRTKEACRQREVVPGIPVSGDQGLGQAVPCRHRGRPDPVTGLLGKSFPFRIVVSQGPYLDRCHLGYLLCGIRARWSGHFFRVQRGHRGKVYSRPRGDV